MGPFLTQQPTLQKYLGKSKRTYSTLLPPFREICHKETILKGDKFPFKERPGPLDFKDFNVQGPNNLLDYFNNAASLK